MRTNCTERVCSLPLFGNLGQYLGVSNNNSNSANSHNNKNKTNKNAVPHDDDEDERKEKKHKLLVGLNSHLQNPTLFPNSQPFNSDPNKRRKTIDPLQTVRFIVTIFNYNPP